MLTPRERCYRAVRREELDMVPLNIWIESPEPLEELSSTLGVDHIERLLRRLNIDYRGFLPNISWLGIGLVSSYEGWFRDNNGRRLYRDSFGVVYRFSSDGRTSMHAEHPLELVETYEYEYPELKEEDVKVVEEFRQSFEDYCVVGAVLQPFETACALFGYNKIFRLMLLEPWKVESVLDRLFGIAERQAALLAEAGVDQVYSGDDVGTQTTMMISPELWRRFLKPRYEKLARTVHKHGAFFHFHSDGWIEPIIPDLVEIGVDVLEPLQPEAMDIARIKRLYGDQLSFEGGIGVQSLPWKSPGEVTAEVKYVFNVLGPTGYTLRPSHTILPSTPLGNIIALYDAANKYRRINVSSPAHSS
ncbi:MAG: uroporphyrinogen decarboxylase family protein [Thermofilaceae archaeon]